MRTFGLIGFPLEHSFSQTYFTEKFFREGIHDCEYKNFPIVSASEFPNLLRQEWNLCGLNVTIPYKRSILDLLDAVDKVAKEIGAINCIKVTDGKTRGFNTDVYGFEESLKPLLGKQHNNALILGSGGSSKAVQYVLNKRGIEFKIVSRNPKNNELSYGSLNEEIISSAKLIINTTPVGQFPDTPACPQIPFEFISSQHLLYDLIYNPELTTFLQNGRNRGAHIKNGWEMLQLQAEKSWEIWNEGE